MKLQIIAQILGLGAMASLFMSYQQTERREVLYFKYSRQTH